MAENIQKQDMSGWFEKGFIAYGKSVIEERAFADIRDGLKPVHRAIMVEILKQGATSDSKPKKVAKISGGVIGNWHPHGDTAVEEALTGMAQEWTNSLPVIKIKGNGGTVFGDGAAAGRYIEARLTPAGDAYGRNLKKGIVPFVPNFDETDVMPTVMPAQLPYILINGISEGIAVGVSSVMPPHNPKEVLEMTIAYIKNPALKTEQLLEFMPGPDFPTGATIINKDDLVQIYRDGAGRIICRATLEYDKTDHAIHVREIPFNFAGSMNNLVMELASATTETPGGGNKRKLPPKIPGVSKVEDYSGKDGIDICLYLQRGVDPKEIENLLFAKTRLESRVPFMFNALNDKEAHRYSLKRYLSEWLDFQHEIVLNEHIMEKQALEEKLEIITGRIIASQCIDPIIDIVKHADNKGQIKDVLMNGTIIEGTDPQYHPFVTTFKFTERQAESVSEYMLYQLTKLDKEMLLKEGQKVRARLIEVNRIIEDEDVRKRLIIHRLQEEMKKLPECKRRTVIIQDDVSTASDIETKAVPMYVAMDKYGYVRTEGKMFENALETNSKARVGFFDVVGNCWNLYLDRVKETKDRGTLISRLIGTEAQIVGLTTQIENEDAEGLFIFENGAMRRVRMNKYMTKTRATKISTKTPKTPMKAYFDIPVGMNIVVVDGKEFPLTKIPLQGYSGTGKQFLEQKEEPYEVSFKQGEVKEEPKPLGKDVFDGVATFTEDGKLLFDWTSLNTENRDGVFSTTYQELITSTLLFIHKDGTAKKVNGDAFTVKTRRTQIKGDKDGVSILTILPIKEDGFLVGSYNDDYQKCVETSGISFQGVLGGGMRVFHTPKHTLDSVVFVTNAFLPVLSFASQPKLYVKPEENEITDDSEYTTMGCEGFSCLVCGEPVKADDPVVTCPDCAAVICKSCAENNGLEEHDCVPEGDE